MTIFTTADTPPGNYPNITITGTGGGQTHPTSYNLTVTEAGVAINPPQVETLPINDPGHPGTVTTTSATVWGVLKDGGGAETCIVWFKYATVDYWNANSSYQYSRASQTVANCSSITLGSPSSYFYFSDVLGSSPDPPLDSNTSYYFEAFAKNGGSW